jgi:hypothetical protein
VAPFAIQEAKQETREELVDAYGHRMLDVVGLAPVVGELATK